MLLNSSIYFIVLVFFTKIRYHVYTMVSYCLAKARIGMVVRTKLWLCMLCLTYVVFTACTDVPPSQSTLWGNNGEHVVFNSSVNPYAGILGECAERACSLDALPFIGIDTLSPTIEDLMNRVVVSHQWMGERFEEVLRAMDADTRHITLQLSRSITLVVISADVRPSFYTAGSSAMYLDPLRLALSEEEVRVIDQTPDFRSSFGDALQFAGVWRYVSNDNEYLYNPAFEGRTLDDVLYYLSRLLFHELAHANDFYPHNTISAISCQSNPNLCSMIPYDVYRTASSNRISRQFGFLGSMSTGGYYLQDSNMSAYAGIRYKGVTANAEQKTWRASDIGGWFESDNANHDYAYASPFEDVAMLTEATLVKYLFDADMDVGYLERPGASIVTVNSPVAWGVRGRIGDSNITRRAKRVMDLMLPGVIPDEFFSDIDPDRAMQSGCSWLQNLELSCVTGSYREKGTVDEHVPVRDIQFDLIGPHDFDMHSHR